MRYQLLLQNASAAAYAIGRFGFDQAVQFNNDSVGRKQLANYLEQRHGCVFTVILDFKEEEFLRKTIPGVRGSDRLRVLQRLRQRSFPGSTLSVAHADAQKRNGRRELDVTVAGIAANSECDEWLTVLSETRTVVANMCSLSLLGSELPVALGLDAGHVLTAVQLSECDYRVCAYLNKLPLISRRVTVPDNHPDGLLREITQTLAYLLRQPECSSQAFVKTLVVGCFDPAEAELISDQIDHALVLSPQQAASALRLQTPLPSQFGDGLFAKLLNYRTGRFADLSTAQHRRYHRRRRVAHGLYACSLSVLLSAAVSAVATAHINREYQSLVEAANGFGGSPHRLVRDLTDHSAYDADHIEAVRGSVRIARILEARASYTPFHFMSAFASDLSGYPAVEIESLNWRQSSGIADDPAMTVSTRGPAAEAGQSELSGHVVIAGAVRVVAEEVADAVSVFNSFVSSLSRSNRYYEVVVLEAPFGIGDNRVTTGSGVGGVKGDSRFLIELHIEVSE